jgi:hypothetical protein
MFESLTLIQTRRMEPVPFLLFGSEFWSKVINFELLADEGTIAPEDLSLFHHVDTAEHGWDIIRQHYAL